MVAIKVISKFYNPLSRGKCFLGPFDIFSPRAMPDISCPCVWVFVFATIDLFAKISGSAHHINLKICIFNEKAILNIKTLIVQFE